MICLLRENIYITKKGDTKYEIITKGINFDQGVYSLFALDKNLFVLKKQYYNKDQKYVKKENSSSNSNTNYDKPFQKDKKEKDMSATQKWYKGAVELKKNLKVDGFLVLKDVEEVRKISYVTRDDINKGDILGIRGFDKNYYIFTKEAFEKVKKQIFDSMVSETITYDELLENTKMSKDKLNGALELLKEQSDIIEIHSGIFKKV